MNLKSAISPLHAFHKIFCLAPYDVDKNSKEKIFVKTKRNYFYIVRATFHTLLLSLSAFYKFINIDKIDFQHNWYTNTYYYISATFLDIFVSIIFMATSVTREKSMISIYNKLNKFSYLTDYKKIHFYVKVQILIFSILFPILIGISIRRGSFLNVVSPIIISVGPFARDYLSFTQFGNLMLILNEQFKSLNEKTVTKRKFEDWNLDYHRLYRITRIIDETFGLQILFNVIVRCYWIISNGYDVIMLVSRDINLSKGAIEHIYIYFPWLFIDIVTLLLIIGVCNKVKIEAKNYVKILARYEENQNLNEYNLWIIRLMDKEVQFTANGLFDMDFTFIISSIGKLTYYIIILAQLAR